MITHVHHINFIVKDLDRATAQYTKRLGLNNFIYDVLEARGVRIARTKLGDSWLVLVQPNDPSKAPARYLKEKGEGFFLISLGTDDLDQQLALWDHKNGAATGLSQRRGLENWCVVDLPAAAFFGAQIQLTEERPPELAFNSDR